MQASFNEPQPGRHLVVTRGTYRVQIPYHLRVGLTSPKGDLQENGNISSFESASPKASEREDIGASISNQQANRTLEITVEEQSWLASLTCV
jgi:hypothetical protein